MEKKLVDKETQTDFITLSKVTISTIPPNLDPSREMSSLPVSPFVSLGNKPAIQRYQIQVGDTTVNRVRHVKESESNMTKLFANLLGDKSDTSKQSPRSSESNDLLVSNTCLSASLGGSFQLPTVNTSTTWKKPGSPANRSGSDLGTCKKSPLLSESVVNPQPIQPIESSRAHSYLETIPEIDNMNSWTSFSSR